KILSFELNLPRSIPEVHVMYLETIPPNYFRLFKVMSLKPLGHTGKLAYVQSCHTMHPYN
ncbi:hypothetical protein AS27_06286, partial [Aptenodytes forsteri]